YDFARALMRELTGDDGMEHQAAARAAGGMMGKMAPGNATEAGSTVTTGIAMGSPKRLAYQESDKHPKIEERGTTISTPVRTQVRQAPRKSMNMIQGYPRTRGSAAFIRGKARPGCQGILTTEHLFKDTDNPLENRMTCYQGINFLN
ncbi:MAG TPA: hypothetical protein PLY50_08020, partial [Burkholderiaceae bacterium]|nr:hypothetical protein [Burkholderiaceae bacterium]